MTEVSRNVGHDEISPETRLCYLQKGLLSTLIIWRSIQESTEGEKRNLRVCDRNAKKRKVYVYPACQSAAFSVPQFTSRTLQSKTKPKHQHYGNYHIISNY